jgi:hypothetical protein
MLLPTTLKSAATELQLGRNHKAAMGARKRRSFFIIDERVEPTIYMVAVCYGNSSKGAPLSHENFFLFSISFPHHSKKNGLPHRGNPLSK